MPPPDRTRRAGLQELWQRLGLSVDWDLEYTTIGTRARRVAQLALIRNIERGEAYQADAPALWDPTFGTAVAQAEIEKRPRPGMAVTLAFHGPDGATLPVMTTRPEPLPAWLEGEEAAALWKRLAGRTVPAAHEEIVAALGETGGLLGEPEPITHAVKF